LLIAQGSDQAPFVITPDSEQYCPEKYSDLSRNYCQFFLVSQLIAQGSDQAPFLIIQDSLKTP
jgi:hypothetical protein